MDKIKAWKEISQEENELITLCSDMIKIPSENPPGNVENMVSYICRFFDKYGIKYEVIRATPTTPNIIARYGNSDGKKIVFNGHCDVVPAGDLTKWDFDPYGGEVKNGKIYGRGTSDMKCGLGAAMYSMAYFAKNKIQLKGEIVMTIVPDEETGGFYGTKWLFDNGYIKGDWGIVAEPTGHDNIEVGQRGSMRTTVTAKGKPAHGSLSPYVGDSALEKLLDFLPLLKELRNLKGSLNQEMREVMEVSKNKLKSIHKIEGIENSMDHVSVNFGTIKGGVKSNMVADSAEAELDIRIPLGMTGDIVKAKIDEILKNSKIQGISVSYMGAEKGNYVSVLDPICSSAAKNAKEVMGIELIMAYQWASSDARYFREASISTIQYGPSDTAGIHSFNETATVSDIVNSAKMYTGIIFDLIS